VRSARILFDGAVRNALVTSDREVCLEDGRQLRADSCAWLPPATGTLYAVGLNYAEHASELSFQAPREPLIFAKAPGALAGQGARCPRPDGVELMHFEGELAVVIGRHARRVPRANALDVVAGYTICNDYAVRDYLENFYRPNLRVKSRDGLTPVGPWIVPVAELGDAAGLGLRTLVNGRELQHGNTRDMIFSVAHLIEYLSGILTLVPGDMITTGTPPGIADVQPGDEVVVEIERIGSLVSTIVSERDYYQAPGQRL
jgi:5-oxopent-3-ene-1,2,5-tricarboxylate decarboxylase / 2-hydroxyhepta-2,4-diene-1,7-dioate isomerase